MNADFVTLLPFSTFMLYELLLNVFEYNFWGRSFWKRIGKKHFLCRWCTITLPWRQSENWFTFSVAKRHREWNRAKNRRESQIVRWFIHTQKNLTLSPDGNIPTWIYFYYCETSAKYCIKWILSLYTHKIPIWCYCVVDTHFLQLYLVGLPKSRCISIKQP